MTEITKPISDTIRQNMRSQGKRFWACDNVSEFISQQDKKILIGEAVAAFEKVLDVLLIDRENDPNSK